MAEARLDEILRRYVQQYLTINKSDFGRAKGEVIPVVELIIKKIALKDPRFIMRLEYRGSVYEKVKIKKADEFDFDLPIVPLQLDEAPNGNVAGVPCEYTTYVLKPALQEVWKNHADPEGKLLSAERVIATFASLVKQSIDDINQKKESSFKLKLSTNHPAVTVHFVQDGTSVYDVDLAPVIQVKKWPENLTIGWAHRGRKGWPTPEVIDSLKGNTPVYLVPKLYQDKTHEKRNYLWRYAFNKGEKKLLLDSDSGADNNCRRNVLRVLKGFLQDLKWPGLKSYHMKTVLLHESETWSGGEEWKDGQLGVRVLAAVRRLRSFIGQDKKAKCKHYFLPAINILEGMNERQKEVLLAKLDEFLENPLAAVLSIVLARLDSQKGLEGMAMLQVAS